MQAIRLFVALVVLLFCSVSPLFAQKLTGRPSIPRLKTFFIDAQILDEGSFQLQRSTGNFTNWITLTNLNAVPSALTFSDAQTNSAQYYRLFRQTDPPVITIQPRGLTNYFGQLVRLEAVVTGSWPLRYQWYKNAQPIPGATSNVLSFAGKTELSGNYNLLISNLWNAVISSTVSVKTVNPVALDIAGRKIHFVVQTGQGDFPNSGTFDTVFDPSGFYTTQSSSVFLNDSGYWQYGLLNESLSRIYLPGSITYPDGAITLQFETSTNGNYSLVAPTRVGSQTGKFNFLN